METPFSRSTVLESREIYRLGQEHKIHLDLCMTKDYRITGERCIKKAKKCLFSGYSRFNLSVH